MYEGYFMSGSEGSHTLEAARRDPHALAGAHQPSLRMAHFGDGACLDHEGEVARGFQVRVAEFDHQGELLAARVAEARHHALSHPGRSERDPHGKLRLRRIRQSNLAGGEG